MGKMAVSPEFPIIFEKCPACGGTDRVTELAMQEFEREKGIKRQADFLCIEKVLVPLLDPRKTTRLTVPIAICYYDICADCGTKRCTKVELVNAPIEYVTKKKPPGFSP